MSHCRAVRAERKFRREYTRHKPWVLRKMQAQLAANPPEPMTPEVTSLLRRIDEQMHAPAGPGLMSLASWGDILPAKLLAKGPSTIPRKKQK